MPPTLLLQAMGNQQQTQSVQPCGKVPFTADGEALGCGNISLMKSGGN
jgi:hypothetical protein